MPDEPARIMGGISLFCFCLKYNADHVCDSKYPSTLVLPRDKSMAWTALIGVLTKLAEREGPGGGGGGVIWSAKESSMGKP
jgi:hypothetical protein